MYNYDNDDNCEKQSFYWNQYINTLIEFVNKVCKNRDESHGLQHAQSVYENATIIYKQTEPLDFKCESLLYFLIVIVSYLHDVADKKYDNDGSLEKKLVLFLDYFTKEVQKNEILKTLYKNSSYWEYLDSEKLIKIIKNVSYTKEIKDKTLQWYDELGFVGIYIRDIVSDADKLDSIGKIGIERCAQYAVHKHKQTFGEEEYSFPDDLEIANHVKEIYHKRLKHIGKHLRTKIGKFMGQDLIADLPMLFFEKFGFSISDDL